MDLELSLVVLSDLSAQSRLDVFLAQALGESRSLVKEWFRRKCVLGRSGRPLKPSAGVQNRSELVVKSYVPPFHRKLRPNPHLQIPILYEDEVLWVLNKPRGISVNALTYEHTQTVANFLLAQAPSLTTWDKRLLEPGIVHRIDQWTSGCLCAAKTPQALEGLQTFFRKRKVLKIYLAMLEGNLDREEEWVDALIHDPKNQRKMKCLNPSREPDAALLQASRRARLKIRPLRIGVHGGRYTLAEVRLYTGRMHQIRVQCASRGFPLVGDSLYGAKTPTSFQGQWLHAHMLSFPHPITFTPLLFRAPIPRELSDFGMETPTLPGC
jgi:23S rRNA pseudouridine1911/1915/1917 synthase